MKSKIEELPSKPKSMSSYREKLDKLIVLLGDKYDLPELNGTEKQIAWASDVRIKFVEEFDKRIEKMSDKSISAVVQILREQVNSRWWIDRNHQNFAEFLSFSETVSEMKTKKIVEKSVAPPEIVEIDARHPDNITVKYAHPEEVAPILKEHTFTQKGYVFTKDIGQNDVGREGLIETLCVKLLKNGLTARVVAMPKPKPVADGYLVVHDGKLAIIANTEAVYKAASRIGSRVIYVDRASVIDIRKLTTTYNVEIMPDAEYKLAEVENDYWT